MPKRKIITENEANVLKTWLDDEDLIDLGFKVISMNEIRIGIKNGIKEGLLLKDIADNLGVESNTIYNIWRKMRPKSNRK